MKELTLLALTSLVLLSHCAQASGTTSKGPASTGKPDTGVVGITSPQSPQPVPSSTGQTPKKKRGLMNFLKGSGSSASSSSSSTASSSSSSSSSSSPSSPPLDSVTLGEETEINDALLSLALSSQSGSSGFRTADSSGPATRQGSSTDTRAVVYKSVIKAEQSSQPPSSQGLQTRPTNKRGDQRIQKDEFGLGESKRTGVDTGCPQDDFTFGDQYYDKSSDPSDQFWFESKEEKFQAVLNDDENTGVGFPTSGQQPKTGNQAPEPNYVEVIPRGSSTGDKRQRQQVGTSSQLGTTGIQGSDPRPEFPTSFEYPPRSGYSSQSGYPSQPGYPSQSGYTSTSPFVFPPPQQGGFQSPYVDKGSYEPYFPPGSSSQSGPFPFQSWSFPAQSLDKTQQQRQQGGKREVSTVQEAPVPVTFPPPSGSDTITITSDVLGGKTYALPPSSSDQKVNVSDDQATSFGGDSKYPVPQEQYDEPSSDTIGTDNQWFVDTTTPQGQQYNIAPEREQQRQQQLQSQPQKQGFLAGAIDSTPVEISADPRSFPSQGGAPYSYDSLRQSQSSFPRDSTSNFSEKLINSWRQSRDMGARRRPVEEQQPYSRQSTPQQSSQQQSTLPQYPYQQPTSQPSPYQQSLYRGSGSQPYSVQEQKSSLVSGGRGGFPINPISIINNKRNSGVGHQHQTPAAGLPKAHPHQTSGSPWTLGTRCLTI